MLFNNTSKIIKQKELLSIDYVPKTIVGRDKEIEDLSFHLSYLFREYPSLPQLIIYGSVGTGKTTVINYVLSELQKTSIEKNVSIKIVKIKGSETKTKYEILKKIFTTIYPNYQIIPNTSSDLYNKILEILSEKGIFVLIFIDEIHELKDNDLNSVLYTLSRLGGDVSFFDNKSKSKLVECEKCKIGYFFVSNDVNITNKLKDNTKSSLTKETLIFKRYTPKQIIDILESRIKEGALYENVLDDGVLGYIASISVKEGQDARYALILLNNVAQECEKRKLNRITEKLIEEVNSFLLQDYMKSLLRDQPPFYLDILSIIYNLYKSGIKLDSKTIWDEYQTRSDLSQVNFSRISQIITSLEKDNIVYVTHSKKTKLRNLSIEENLKEIEAVLLEKLII
jgi:orc1/cdc6 family replication initiation protein